MSQATTDSARVFPSQRPSQRSSQRPVLDGVLSDRAWVQQRAFADFRRFPSDTGEPIAATKMWAHADARFFYFAFRCSLPRTSDYVAVEFAPVDLHAHPQKWRFVATLRGRAVAEKLTRETRSKPDVPGFQIAVKAGAGFVNVEMQVPRAAIGNPTRFRFGALRSMRLAPQSARITFHAIAPTSNPFSMPITTPDVANLTPRAAK